MDSLSRHAHYLPKQDRLSSKIPQKNKETCIRGPMLPKPLCGETALKIELKGEIEGNSSGPGLLPLLEQSRAGTRLPLP